MKLSLISLTLSLSVLAAACGTNDESDKLQKAQMPTEAPAVATPPPAPAGRRLVVGSALPTSPVNLIADPGFGLAGQQAAFGSFFLLDEETFSPVDIAASVDSRSPAGFGGATAILRPDGATNKTSAPLMLLTSFAGGTGPFHAEVWLSKSDTSGKPVELTIDAKGMRASITDGSPEGEAFDLLPVEGASRTTGGRTWTLLRADVTKPLAYGGFFVVHTGTGGGQFHVAAPGVVPQPLVDNLAATRSLSVSALRARAKTTTERAAILRYTSRPPQLTPAAPRPHGE